LEETAEEGQHKQREKRGKDKERLAIGLVAGVLGGCLLWVLGHGIILFSLDGGEKGIRQQCQERDKKKHCFSIRLLNIVFLCRLLLPL
jgi:hypothetical protein